MYTQEIICNVVIILCVGILGAFFAPSTREFGNTARFVGFVWAAWTAFCVSAVGWIIFVAAHFIGKYW